MRQRGFTLLEILAALAITVIGIAAVVKVTGSAVDVLQTTEDRVLGSWVASNRLAELRLSRDWPAASTRDASEKYGGRDWYYREKISETADPDLLRVDVSVYSDREQIDMSAELFGYIARYSPPTETPLPWASELLGQEQAPGGEGEGAAGGQGQDDDNTGTGSQGSASGSSSTSSLNQAGGTQGSDQSGEGSQGNAFDSSSSSSSSGSNPQGKGNAGDRWWTKSL